MKADVVKARQGLCHRGHRCMSYVLKDGQHKSTTTEGGAWWIVEKTQQLIRSLFAKLATRAKEQETIILRESKPWLLFFTALFSFLIYRHHVGIIFDSYGTHPSRVSGGRTRKHQATIAAYNSKIRCQNSTYQDRDRLRSDRISRRLISLASKRAYLELQPPQPFLSLLFFLPFSLPLLRTFCHFVWLFYAPFRGYDATISPVGLFFPR